MILKTYEITLFCRTILKLNNKMKNLFTENIAKYLLVALALSAIVLLPELCAADEQTSSDRMQKILLDDLEKASDKLHIEAKKLYNDGKYWEAARDLIILLDFYQDYSNIDDAVFLLGDCLYEIGIMDGATRIYRYLVKKFIRSPLLPRALLGLQRIEYDTGNYARCLEFYNAISRGTPEQDVLDVSRYYASLAYFHFKDYPNAVKIADEISDASPYFDYGMYTKGLSLLKMKNIRDAIHSFRKVCSLPIISDERRSVVDESHLTLGYLYYELGYTEHALGEFRAVSSGHDQYGEALIAEAWAAIKLEKYKEAVTPLTELIANFPESESAEEAFFLLGRSYLKLTMYEEALKVYEHLLAIFPEKEMVPAIVREVNSSLTEETIKIEKIKMDLLVMESRLLDALPIGQDDGTPTQLVEEKQKIADSRMALLKQLQVERETFTDLSDQMASLQQLAERRETRRDWRAYAQYGKSRALFLINRPQ